jgi:hypothetical protein
VPEDESQLALTPLERKPRREPQTYQELSPQLDFLYRAESNFSQWVQFADAKSGGVILVLSIGALDVFHHATDFIHAHNLHHAAWGWISLVAFLAALVGIMLTIAGVANTLFPNIRESKPSLFFFGVAATFPDGDAYGRAVTEKRETEIIEQVSIQAWNLANIANDKYASLRRAYMGALVFLLAWGVARIALSLAS